jgi:hypothetical protein
MLSTVRVALTVSLSVSDSSRELRCLKLVCVLSIPVNFHRVHSHTKLSAASTYMLCIYTILSLLSLSNFYAAASCLFTKQQEQVSISKAYQQGIPGYPDAVQAVWLHTAGLSP